MRLGFQLDFVSYLTRCTRPKSVWLVLKCGACRVIFGHWCWFHFSDLKAVLNSIFNLNCIKTLLFKPTHTIQKVKYINLLTQRYKIEAGKFCVVKICRILGVDSFDSGFIEETKQSPQICTYSRDKNYSKPSPNYAIRTGHIQN